MSTAVSDAFTPSLLPPQSPKRAKGMRRFQSSSELFISLFRVAKRRRIASCCACRREGTRRSWSISLTASLCCTQDIGNLAVVHESAASSVASVTVDLPAPSFEWKGALLSQDLEGHRAAACIGEPTGPFLDLVGESRRSPRFLGKSGGIGVEGWTPQRKIIFSRKLS